MFIVEFLQDYKHTPRRTWRKGEMPTLDRDLAKKVVNELKVAKWVGEGCGCIGIDEETILRHTLLAMRGIEDDETGDEEEAEKDDTVTKQDGAFMPQKSGIWQGKK